MNTISLAHDFVDLTNRQLQIDSILPTVSHFFALPSNYKDSVYSISFDYPEYQRLTKKQRRAYKHITRSNDAPLSPALSFSTYEERKRGTLEVEFCPIVSHEGHLSFLKSYRPTLTSTANSQSTMAKSAQTITLAADDEISESTQDSASVYASQSILRSGNWAKIRVSETGIHRLTSDVIRRAGFTDMSKVRIFGYGGALVPETLTQDYIREHDDLQEVATYTLDDEKYFYAQGPVSWDSNTSQKRTRNPYSDYGYYFITADDAEPLTCTEEELIDKYNSSTDAHHFLYENDDYAWAQIGRNLVDATTITSDNPMTVNVIVPKGNTQANVQVAITSGGGGSYRITCVNTTTGTFSTAGTYDKALWTTRTFNVTLPDSLAKDADGNTILPLTIESTNASVTLRLDYVSAYFSTVDSLSALSSASCPAADYYCNITNQNLHAHTPVDLLIIIPTSQKTLAEATELGELHKEYDGMTYRVVPADEMYNEFSSGTPDISAYKRYLKMFYDKASDASGMISHVLLFGDAMWDNRMNTLSSSLYSPDDYLLAYETENSYNDISSTAIDDFITVMQDGKTVHADSNEGRDSNLQFDVAVGRIPVVQSADAQTVVDKISHYITSSPAGQWQNEMMFIGDDGDENSHMKNINDNADDVMAASPGYHVKKVMLDAYEMESTSTGNTYPVASEEIKTQQNDGALIMNYGGHASWSLLSHEKILVLSDFMSFKGTNYSVWFAAACETVPFDGTTTTLGEAAILNADGGAVAFIGAVRTVLETYNTQIDKRFMAHVLERDSLGNTPTIGEALRLAKNDLVRGNTSVGIDRSVNKHHYTIIGDPAMRLATPRYTVVVDSINNSGAEQVDTIAGNSTVYVKGHIETGSGMMASSFNGEANILVRDAEQTIVCRQNNASEASTAFTYVDRPGTLYKGTCEVVEGNFSFAFKMPRDISNDGGTGLITIYAKDDTNSVAANGESSAFVAQGWEDVLNDNVGPSIYAYLNNTSFRNGDVVNRTPYFVAELSDKDGINATGASVGHNLELTVDGQADLTYDLDANFVFDTGSYTSGQTYYVLPTLDAGSHSLTFRAWDLLGNSNSVSLSFSVAVGVRPEITAVYVTPNPVTDVATFYVTHDQQGSEATVKIEIIDPAGRLVDVLQWNDTFSASSPTTSYRWTPSGVSRGLYLYRVKVSTDGSDYAEKTQKLIIAQ